jgi:hypothetical protein
MALVPSFLAASFHVLWPGGPTVQSWSDLAQQPDVRKASLAIVGNAGYLAELEQGAWIDAHDLVLRMNNFRTDGFVRQVGRKLDIFFTTFHHDIALSHPALMHAPFIATSVPFNLTKRRSDGLQHRHAIFIATGLKRLRRKVAFVPSQVYFAAVRRSLGRYPSTGAMAILLAVDFLLPVCGNVFITGFSFFEGQGHYFHNGPVAPRNHDPQREQALLRLVLAPHVSSGRVQLDSYMSHQLGLSESRQHAA